MTAVVVAGPGDAVKPCKFAFIRTFFGTNVHQYAVARKKLRINANLLRFNLTFVLAWFFAHIRARGCAGGARKRFITFL